MHQYILCFFLLVTCKGFAQSNTDSENVKLSIVALKPDISVGLDFCVHVLYVTVKLENIGDSVIYFPDLNNALAYQSFSFEIQTVDSLYDVRRANKLWWRSVVSILKVEPEEFTYIDFVLSDSACSLDGVSRGSWVGLPALIKGQASVRALYHPLNDGDIATFERILNRSDYRKLYYRDTLNSDSINNPRSDQTQKTLKKLYNKPLASQAKLIR